MEMFAAPSLSCPLCSASLSPSDLEGHLRYELALPLCRCALCPQSFVDAASAERHFRGPLAEHPGSTPQLIQPSDDEAKTGRLVELLRLARGGAEAIQQRLCVCGHCRLLCREAPTLTGQTEASNARVPRMEDQSDRSGPTQAAREPHILPSEVQQLSQAQEASEEEEQALPTEVTMAPADVKPDLSDLKQKFNSDGKVSCLQCGARVDKNGFSWHVRYSHIQGNPHQCLLCPKNTKTRAELSRHQKKEHDQDLTEDSHSTSLSKDVVKDWIKICFGEAKNVDYKRLHCRPCDKQVQTQGVKPHIAESHLKKPIYKCRVCDWVSCNTSAGSVNKHVKRAHKVAPGPETVDDSGLQHYAPIIKAMIPQLFDL